MVEWLCNQNVSNVLNLNLRFVKEQKAEGLLSNLGIITLLTKIPLLNMLLSV